MHCANRTDYRHDNTSLSIDQDLDKQLFEALLLVDIETAELVYQTIIGSQNQISKKEWIRRINDALDYVDTGLLSASFLKIKRAAKSIVKLTKNLYKTKNYHEPTELVSMFYSNHNRSIHAPIIRLAKCKDNAKQLCNVIDEEWWLKILSDTIEQNREHFRGLIGLVNQASPYASDCAVKKKKQSDRRKKKYLDEKTIVIKATGEIKPLGAIRKTEEQEFAETWCILRGIDEYAQTNGMPSAMITITAPSEYHPSPQNLTSLNAIDAQKFIASKWHDITKFLYRYKNQVLMFRVVEAHINGTPHWHILIYFKPEIKKRLQSKLMRAFDVDNLNNHLISWQDTDRSVGSFLSYVSKSIIPPSLATFNKILSGNNDRVDAFRSIWSFRSCQFIGLPKGYLYTWRRLRGKNYITPNSEQTKELLKKIKNNDFSSFLTAIINGDIEIVESNYGNDRDIIVFGELITKDKKDVDNKNVKVNVNNNLNKSKARSDSEKSEKKPSLIGYIKKTIGVIIKKTRHFIDFLPKKMKSLFCCKSTSQKSDSS